MYTFKLAKETFNLLTKRICKKGNKIDIAEENAEECHHVIHLLNDEGYIYLFDKGYSYKEINLKSEGNDIVLTYCYNKDKIFLKAIEITGMNEMKLVINEDAKAYHFITDFVNDELDNILKGLTNIISENDFDSLLNKTKSLYREEIREDIITKEEEKEMENYEVVNPDFDTMQEQINSSITLNEENKNDDECLLDVEFDEKSAITFIKKFVAVKGEEKEKDSKITIDMNKAGQKYNNGLMFDLDWYKIHIDNVMMFCDQVKFNIGSLKIKLFKDKSFYIIKLINGKKEISLKIKDTKGINKVRLFSIKDCNNRKMVKFVMSTLQLVGVIITK